MSASVLQIQCSIPGTDMEWIEYGYRKMTDAEIAAAWCALWADNVRICDGSGNVLNMAECAS